MGHFCPAGSMGASERPSARARVVARMMARARVRRGVSSSAAVSEWVFLRLTAACERVELHAVYCWFCVQWCGAPPPPPGYAVRNARALGRSLGRALGRAPQGLGCPILQGPAMEATFASRVPQRRAPQLAFAPRACTAPSVHRLSGAP